MADTIHTTNPPRRAEAVDALIQSVSDVIDTLLNVHPDISEAALSRVCLLHRRREQRTYETRRQSIRLVSVED